MAIATHRFLTSRTRWFVFGLLIVVSVYLLAVTPARTYFQQRQQMAVVEERYKALSAANDELTKRVAALQTDETIAHLARERYELVPAGARAYAVMPPSKALVPEQQRPEESRGWFFEAADTLSFWN